ncbi:sugar kinase [Jannaschia sp. S6380]|uniref:sugar kinase n=1 Tax=Jannaschia sp. S6380 TaxID=2926408 RepID=UPI001FF18103|nr:sugar kinase [Jannaschia sp. S6380]
MFRNHALLAIGEILVEFVSHVRDCGLERIGPYSGPYPSGAPAIFADQAARQGARSRMIGGVGADGFGRAVLSRLRADGVDLDAVTTAPDLPTGTAFVSYYRDGRRDFIFHLAGTAAERLHVPDAALTARPTLLHVSAASLGRAPLRTAILSAVDTVLAAGGAVSCDPNARPELMRDAEARAALDHVMARARILLPSIGDLAFLFPDLPEAEAMEAILTSGADIVVLKRGAQGATVAGPEGRHDLAGHPVEEVDPTGAGDCFCGTFLAALTRGASVRQAAVRANAAGAIAVTRRGPMEGNSTPAEIDAFLTAHGGGS